MSNHSKKRERQNNTPESPQYRNFYHLNSYRSNNEVTRCIKIPLLISNLMFWLVGIAMIAIGIYAWIQKDTFNNIGQLISQKTLFFDPAFLLIIAGCLVFIIAFFGCFGAFKENRICLCFYCIALCIVFFSQMALAVYATIHRQSTNDKLESNLINLVSTYQDDVDLNNLVDWVQGEWLKCCGIQSFRDWALNKQFNCSSQSMYACTVPKSCCLDKNHCLTQNILIDKADTSMIYIDGCLQKAYQWLVKYSTQLALIATALILSQIIGISLALGLRSAIRSHSQWTRLYFD